MNEAAKFVLRNIRMGCRLEGVYRHDIYELPPDSIRELIVNAVMNCSYIQASHIQVAIYDDRLEITSPGGLLPGVTIDLMKEGFSKIRNRSLANAFSYMNLVEAWGSGIPKLMRAMKEYGLREPEFIDMEVAFRINLYRGQNETNGVEKGTEVSPNADKMQGSADKVQDCADKAPDNANKPPTNRRQTADKMPINEQEQTIYKYVLENNGITTVKAMKILDLKERRTRELLVKMVENGWLRKEGSSRSTIYVQNTGRG